MTILKVSRILVYMIACVNRWGCPLTPNELKAIFLKDVPTAFLSDVVMLYRAAYAEAFKQEYRRFAPSEAHDVLGHNRRAIIEGSLRDIVARHHGMKASVQQNRRGTQSYTEIRSGQVVLTESCLPYPQSQLRQADFRGQYARTLQHSIGTIQEDTVIEDGAVFAVLVHGPQMAEGLKLDWVQLGYAFAGFPTTNFRSWEGKIEMMTAYGRPLATESAAEEHITVDFMPKVRRDHGTGKSETGA